MVSIASVVITAPQHIWCSSNLILLVGPKVVYISLTWWQSKLSFFCSFILPTWTINSAITTFNSCWKDHYLFFLNTWQDPALWGRGSSVRKIEPGVLSGFVCFGENRSVTVKHTSKTDGLFALSCFCSSSGTGLILAFSTEELYIVHTAGGAYTTWTPCAEQHRNATMAHHSSLMSSIVFFFPSKTDGLYF